MRLWPRGRTQYGRREIAVRFVVGTVLATAIVIQSGWPWWLIPVYMAVFAGGTAYVWKRGRIAAR